jgi:predicted 2-oxoglutarate/Fe(II)-dependent dioxygenase YbiX
MYALDPGLRHKIRVVENFVAPSLCEEVVRSVNASVMQDASVDDNDPTVAGRVDKEVRNVLVHDIRAVFEEVNGTIQHIVDELIEPFYGVRIESWEQPDILIYPPGGFYVTHNDGESVVHDPVRYVWEWRRTVDRDISVVWYLNDDFEGGGLFFPQYQFTAQPGTGMVVTFPSTHEFAHAAQSVLRGTRYAVVTWMAAVGTPRVQSPPAPHVKSNLWRQKAPV